MYIYNYLSDIDNVEMGHKFYLSASYNNFVYNNSFL